MLKNQKQYFLQQVEAPQNKTICAIVSDGSPAGQDGRLGFAGFARGHGAVDIRQYDHRPIPLVLPLVEGV